MVMLFGLSVCVFLEVSFTFWCLIIKNAHPQDEPWKIIPEQKILVVNHMSNLKIAVRWEGKSRVGKFSWVQYPSKDQENKMTILKEGCNLGNSDYVGAFNSIMKVTSYGFCQAGIVKLIVPAVSKDFHGFLRFTLYGDQTRNRPIEQSVEIPVYIAASIRHVGCTISLSDMCNCKIFGVYGRFPVHFISGDGTKHECQEAGLLSDTRGQGKLIQYCNTAMGNASMMTLHLTHFRAYRKERVKQSFTFCTKGNFPVTLPSLLAKGDGLATPAPKGNPYPDIIIQTGTVIPEPAPAIPSGAKPVVVVLSVMGILVLITLIVVCYMNIKARRKPHRLTTRERERGKARLFNQSPGSSRSYRDVVIAPSISKTSPVIKEKSKTSVTKVHSKKSKISKISIATKSSKVEKLTIM